MTSLRSPQIILIFLLSWFFFGCISPKESVTISIEGSDHMMVNITKTRGFILTVRNEGPPIEDMRIVIHTPRFVHLNASFFEPTVNAETGNETLGKTYSLIDDMEKDEIIDYVFDYTPHDVDYVQGDGWGFQFHVEILNSEGDIIGNMTTEWSVTRV